MALYFKCPHCGLYFIDYGGEFAKEDTEECWMYGPYLCPNCGTEANYCEDKDEYNNAQNNLKL